MPPTTQQAVELVNGAITALNVGPEGVRAADPARVTIDWQPALSSARCSKMRAIRGAVRQHLAGVLHQLPEVFLVADDGAVVGLFGISVGRACLIDVGAAGAPPRAAYDMSRPRITPWASVVTST